MNKKKKRKTCWIYYVAVTFQRKTIFFFLSICRSFVLSILIYFLPQCYVQWENLNVLMNAFYYQCSPSVWIFFFYSLIRIFHIYISHVYEMNWLDWFISMAYYLWIMNKKENDRRKNNKLSSGFYPPANEFK